MSAFMGEGLVDGTRLANIIGVAKVKTLASLRESL
jgi:hypothetical protein